MWQGHDFCWMDGIHKMTKPFYHVEKSGHMTNKNSYIFISTWTIAIKLGRWWHIVRSHKLSSHMSFRSRGHMRSRDKEKHIFTSTRSMVTKLYEVMAYEKSSLPKMVKWHNSHMTNKNVISVFTSSWLLTSTRWWLMVWTITHKVSWFFNQVIIYNPMKNKKHYTSDMDAKCDRVVAYDMGHPAKNCITLNKKFFLFAYFFSTARMCFNLK